jgi:hypothetical protein
MSAEAHKALVRRFYKDAIDAGNLALIDTLFAPHYAFYPAGSSAPIDRQTFKAFLHAFRTAFGFYHTITIFHFAAGTIEAGWSSFAELGMLRQLGMLPALVQTSA